MRIETSHLAKFKINIGKSVFSLDNLPVKRVPECWGEFVRKLLDFYSMGGGTIHASGGEQYSLRRLFTINPEDESNVMRKLQFYDGRLPSGMLPIGDDYNGDLYLLSVNEANFGQIFYWSHEKDGDETSPDYVDYVADNFSDFVSRMSYEENPGGAVEYGDVEITYIDPDLAAEMAAAKKAK